MGSWTHESTAVRFAQMAAEGKTEHMPFGAQRVFVDNNTIFSYGRHFPIARIIRKGVVLFTTRGYSVSTSRHKGIVKGALNREGVIIIEQDNIREEDKSASRMQQARILQL